MSYTVMELVTFRINESTSPEEFASASEAVNVWVRAQPGFVSRALSRGDDGLWFDVVFWESRATAQAASQSFMTDLGQSAFMVLIDASSVKMSHAQVRSQA